MYNQYFDGEEETQQTGNKKRIIIRLILILMIVFVLFLFWIYAFKSANPADTSFVGRIQNSITHNENGEEIVEYVEEDEVNENEPEFVEKKIVKKTVSTSVDKNHMTVVPVMIIVGKNQDEYVVSTKTCFSQKMEEYQGRKFAVYKDIFQIEDITSCLRGFIENPEHGIKGEILYVVEGAVSFFDDGIERFSFDFDEMRPTIYDREVYIEDYKIKYADNDEVLYDYYAGKNNENSAKASIVEKQAPVWDNEEEYSEPEEPYYDEEVEEEVYEGGF